MEAQIEMIKDIFKKELEGIQKKTELNNTITKMKNTLEGNNSRIHETEERKSDLDYRMLEITVAKKKRIKKKE